MSSTAKIEEDEGDEQHGSAAETDDLEGDVALGADDFLVAGSLALDLALGQRHGALDDTPALHDADDAGHGDAANADASAIVFEDVLGRHLADGRCDGGIPDVEHRVGHEQVERGNDEPPHTERAEGDDEGIAEAHDIAQAEHGGAGVDLEHELGMVGDILSQASDARGEVLIPQSEGADDEVVETAYQAGEQEGLGLAAALRARHQHLRGGRGLGEGILAVHILDEILAEGDEEKDAQHAAKGRSQEDLKETGLQVAPATTAPEQAPILWMITFSPMAFLRWVACCKPMAMMAIGMAASNT